MGRELVFRVSIGVLYAVAMFAAMRLSREVDGDIQESLIISGVIFVTFLTHRLIWRRS